MTLETRYISWLLQHYFCKCSYPATCNTRRVADGGHELWAGCIGGGEARGGALGGARPPAAVSLESQPSFAVHPVFHGGTVRAAAVRQDGGLSSKPWRQEPAAAPSYMVRLDNNPAAFHHF